MLTKRRNAGKPNQNIAKLERLKLPVMKIKMSDYETYYHDKERLKEAAELWLAEPLDLDATTDLETLRKLLAKDYNVDSCCFLDCKRGFKKNYIFACYDLIIIPKTQEYVKCLADVFF